MCQLTLPVTLALVSGDKEEGAKLFQIKHVLNIYWVAIAIATIT